MRPGLRTEGGPGPAARDSSPQATPQRLRGHQVPLSGSAVGGPGLAPRTRFQNNGLPRLVWHPLKTTSKLPVVKHHINIVSLQNTGNNRGGLTQRRSRAHVWSRGARRRGLDGMSRQAGSILQLAARFLNSHLETETAALGTGASFHSCW